MAVTNGLFEGVYRHHQNRSGIVSVGCHQADNSEIIYPNNSYDGFIDLLNAELFSLSNKYSNVIFFKTKNESNVFELIYLPETFIHNFQA